VAKLTFEDKAIIENLDREVGRYLDTIKRAQQFKLDDFLILKIGVYGNKISTQTNSYGAPIKYKVVHVNAHGIPFVKRVNKNGEPMGRISSCIGMTDDEYYLEGSSTIFAFELDPDYADSILLQDNYDPTSLHRSKKDIWKAVTEHNKACKVPTRDLKDLVIFFESVNVGDTLWTSNVGSYFVQDKKATSSTEFLKYARGNMTAKQVKILTMSNVGITTLTVRDKHGNVKNVTPDFFHYRALYTDRPRTYKELNI
jgi:hypothetical protein